MNNYKAEKVQDVGVQMIINLKDDEPVSQRARRLSAAEKGEANTIIKGWLEEGIIRPSESEYASPIVLAKKKNGSTRLCVDYRLLNKKIVRDRYPLPLVEDQLDSLQGSRVFSTLDLANGFLHVYIEEGSRKYTSFVVPDGQYEFLKVPFGLCNSPSVFQRYVNAIFRDLIARKIVLTYMDDLIVHSLDNETGIENLRIVLDKVSRFGLKINWSKCRFLQTAIEYLGHVIEGGSISPAGEKIKAVSNFKTSTCAKEIQSFLGSSGYFRKYIPGFSVIARPLSNLLRNDVKFKFELEQQQAIQTLKKFLCSQPVLKLYIVGAETELHTDASSHGYGAILMQRDNDDNAFHTVYYASGKTTPAEEKFTSYELEVLAIVKALEKFRVYL